MSTHNPHHQTDFEFDETFWAWVQQEPTAPATPACPLKFFKYLHEEAHEDNKLQQKMQQVYDQFFDEMDRFDQEMEDAIKKCNRPKERIQEAMSYLKCSPTTAAELFNEVDEIRRQQEEQEALAERRRAWALHVEHRRVQAEAQRRADYQRASAAYARAYAEHVNARARHHMYYYL